MVTSSSRNRRVRRKPVVLIPNEYGNISAYCQVCHTQLKPYSKDNRYAVCPREGTLYPVEELQIIEQLNNEDEGYPILVSRDITPKRQSRTQNMIDKSIRELQRKGATNIQFEVSIPESTTND